MSEASPRRTSEEKLELRSELVPNEPIKLIVSLGIFVG